MKNLPLDPKVELFYWGPVPAYAYYTGDFLTGIFDKEYFPKMYPGAIWPKGLALYKEGFFVFINEFPELRECGAELFMRYLFPVREREKARKNWEIDLDTLQAVEEEIDKTFLPSLSKKEFIRLWQAFHTQTITFWRHVTIPELANYGSLSILERELRKYIKKENALHAAMEVLTAPEQASFYKQEEMELEGTQDIAEHTKKYSWLKNSYASISVLLEQYFEERKKTLPKNIREDFEKKQKATREKKQALQKLHSLPDEVMDVARAIMLGIEWQDERKRDIWIYLHYKKLLLREAARRTSIGEEQLLNFRELEIQAGLESGFDSVEVSRRMKGVGFLCSSGKVIKLDTVKVLEYWDIYVKGKNNGSITEFKGITVSKGKGRVRGVVKVVFNPHTDSFPEGAILVTPMTTAEYVFLIKNARAIITDTGGLTSHAAVVSREFGIPCIVGTKIATQVLKDGDVVEVDTEKGMVKIIEKR
ncbi:MAG: Phosphoenolpyruvate synthase/pyruvate phosphate dikinase [Parcubacteria group bacterium GW2011_GWC2_45_7]|nr:MAG: Phosphoenolpyruvate synthase/pyruvate phosphate dikinase [Parcubacteria group bacterium GW2011_GWC2_45_7]